MSTRILSRPSEVLYAPLDPNHYSESTIPCDFEGESPSSRCHDEQQFAGMLLPNRDTVSRIGHSTKDREFVR